MLEKFGTLGSVQLAYLRDEILQLGMFFSTSFEMGRLGTGFVNFLSILLLALGTITGGGFFVGGGDIARDLTSQSLVEFVLPFGDTVPRYLASPLLFLCTVAGLRNSDELFATSTDMVSLFFLIYRHISQHARINDGTFDSNFLTISRLSEETRAFHRR